MPKHYFSCKKENSKWFFNLLLNHCGVSNLCQLVAHNYHFFGGTFDHLPALELSLRFKKGFNYKSVGSSVKNRYFSDLKEIIRDFYFEKSGIGYRDNRNSIYYSMNFVGNDLHYFAASKDFCYFSEPDCADYIKSRDLELPDVKEDLEEYYKRRCGRAFQDQEGTIIQILNSMSYSGIEDELDDELFTLHHPLEGCEPQDLTEAETEELAQAKSFVSKSRGDITREIEEFVIQKFNYLDINHLNRPLILPEAVKDMFEGVEKRMSLELGSFRFQHGVRGVEILSVEDKMAEIKSATKYLKERLVYMGGVSEEYVPKEIWDKHMSMLKSLKKINQKQKKASEKYEKMEKRNFEDMMRSYLAKKCQIMLDIKSLYPKYTYIQDEYLDRDTEYMKEINVCQLVSRGLRYFNEKRKLERVSEEQPDRSVFAAEFSPSNLDISKGKHKLESEEAEDVAKGSFSETVASLKALFDNSKKGFQEDWTEEFLKYLSDSSPERLKSKNHRLIKFKEEHNALIKVKKNWDDMDRDYFLKNLEMIFEHDDDFEKYLTAGLKKSTVDCLVKIKGDINSVLSIANTNPLFIDKMNKMDGVVIEKKSKEYKVVNSGTVFLDFLKSFIDVDRGITRRPGVKIKELEEGESSLKSKKYSDAKSKSVLEKKWQERRDVAIRGMAKIINSYVNIYNSLGDSINISPHKLDLEMAYCTCSDKESSRLAHHVHLPNFKEKCFEIYHEIEPEIDYKKERLSKCDAIIERSNKKKKSYLDFVENMRVLENENRIYREKMIKEKLEKIKLKKRTEEEERLRLAYKRINEGYACERERLKDRIRKGVERLNSMTEKRNEELRKENEALMDDYNRLIESKISVKSPKIDKFKTALIEEELILREIKGMNLSHEEECKVLKGKITDIYKRINIFKEERRAKKKAEWEEKNTAQRRKPVSNIFSVLENEDTQSVDYESDNESDNLGEEGEKHVEEDEVFIEYPKLVEFKNKYEILYENEELVYEARRMSEMFMSSSKNLEVICRLDIQKKKSEMIRNSIEDRIYEYGYCSKSTIQGINESFGSHYIKKYKVRKIEKLLELIFICYRSNVYLDYSYIKSKYGMKRCQSKYLLKGIQMSLNKMSKLHFKKEGKSKDETGELKIKFEEDLIK